MGAEIEGLAPTRSYSGPDALNGATHSVVPDRIEAGTYAMAAGITGER